MIYCTEALSSPYWQVAAFSVKAMVTVLCRSTKAPSSYTIGLKQVTDPGYFQGKGYPGHKYYKIRLIGDHLSVE